MLVQLMDQRDTFHWTLHQHGHFTVRSMYKVLAANNVMPQNHIIWKLKIPLKIKIFMWYLFKGIALTKDNLARRRWKGSLKCCFCNIDETIQHLFFDCQLARLIWRVIHISFNLPRPTSIVHLFDGWLQGLGNKIKYVILAGASAFCWAIWLCRNDEIFNATRAFSPLQALFRGTHWIRHWALLQKEEDRPQINSGCRVLESAMMELFASHGWSFSGRLLPF
jgi:hypothetical protein